MCLLYSIRLRSKTINRLIKIVIQNKIIKTIQNTRPIIIILYLLKSGRHSPVGKHAYHGLHGYHVFKLSENYITSDMPCIKID